MSISAKVAGQFDQKQRLVGQYFPVGSHPLKYGAAANNIRGRSLKIEPMQQWRPFHSCRMRITMGEPEVEEGNAWQCDGQVARLLRLHTCDELWVAPEEEKDKDTADQGYLHLPTKGC
ncbi:hypothetical protein BDFG_00411 [Blastomyces dermatitidis ATCC 26199]|nr:hypothetical protein BDFG_00411 [Blastomyces dermatitidis ATCC 26199]